MSYNPPFATGQYTGNDSSGRLISVGFKPVALMIWWDVGGEDGMLFTTDALKSLDDTSDLVLRESAAGATANTKIVEFVSSGFVITSDGNGVINQTGATSNYHYVAFSAHPGVLTGTYTGDANSRQTVPLGKRPGVAFINKTGSAELFAKLSTNATDDYMDMDTNYSQETDGLFRLTENALDVGGATDFNQDGADYSYFCIFPDVIPGVNDVFVGSGSGTAFVHQAIRPRFVIFNRPSDRIGFKTETMPGVENPICSAGLEWTWDTTGQEFTENGILADAFGMNASGANPYMILF